MVRVLKFFGYMLFFILALMYFTPKVALYYLAENELKPHGVVITDEDAQDNGFTLSIKDAVVTFKSIESAQVKNIDLAIFGLYNKVTAEGISLASTAESFLPRDIEFVDIQHSILNPLIISASSKGGFGEAELSVDILERKVLLKVQPSKLMQTKYRTTLRELKKSKDGGYEYAKTF
jgi:hypothetical protein